MDVNRLIRSLFALEKCPLNGNDNKLWIPEEYYSVGDHTLWKRMYYNAIEDIVHKNLIQIDQGAGTYQYF